MSRSKVLSGFLEDKDVINMAEINKALPEGEKLNVVKDPQATLAASLGTLSSPDIQTSVNIIQEQFPGTQVSQDDKKEQSVPIHRLN